LIAARAAEILLRGRRESGGVEMKYFTSATPGPMPPTPEQFDAAIEWLDGKLDDGTFDCVYGFLEGGGFAIANVDSHREALELMADYPLYAMVTWEVRPLLDFKEGLDTIRAKLGEVQAAMAGG
jgi:hypothetical protein